MRAAAREVLGARKRRGVEHRALSGKGTLTLAEAYSVLGLPITASATEIKTGLHRAVAKWHPDRLDGMAEELRAWAAEKMARINAAYEVVRQSSLVVREL